MSFKTAIEKPGFYIIEFRYANGNGPTNTENKCTIRTLQIENRETGTVVFPQRGKNEWNNWGCSNPVKVYLSKGRHTLSLLFKDFDDNMNGGINQSMIDFVRLIRMEN